MGWEYVGPEPPATPQQHPGWEYTGPGAPPPREYSWSEVPGAAVSNFLPNAGDTISGIADHVKERGITGTAADLGKTYVGMWQKFIPGQQEWEKQYFDPVFHGTMEHYGADKLKQGDVTGAGKQFRRAIAEKPFDAMLDFSAVAPMAGAAGRAVSPVHRAGKAAGKVITPFQADEAHRTAAKGLKAEGIPQTAGQKTGNRFLKFAESELGGAATADKIDNQTRAFTRRVASRVGLKTDRLTTDVLLETYKDVGGRIGAATQGYDVRLGRNARHKASQITTRYLDSTKAGEQIPLVAKVNDQIQHNRIISNENYAHLRHELGEVARGSADYETKKALFGLQQTLDDAMEKGIPPANVTALKEARKQYRNYLIVEEAMKAGPGPTIGAGYVTPDRLDAGIKSVVGKRGYLHGKSDFGDLAKHGQVGMSKLPDSGTASRWAMRAIPGAAGAAMFGFGPEGLGLTAAMAASPFVAGKALMSGPVQKILSNQIVPSFRPVTAPLGAAATPGVSFLAHGPQTEDWGKF